MLRKAIVLACLSLFLSGTSYFVPRMDFMFEDRPCKGSDLYLGDKRAIIEALDAAPETRAVLIVVDGCRAVKAYRSGFSDENRFISWSMAKSVTAMLVGELVADGRLALDAPAPIVEWRKLGDPRHAITLGHLLAMSSGLKHTEVGQPIEKSDTNQALFVSGTEGMAARAIGQTLEAKPGTKFEYSSLTTIILAEIVTRALTASRDPRVRARAYRAFAEERLFAPAGITSAVMEFDGAGTQIGGSIIHMTLDDWGRIGRLLLDGEGVEGAQAIAPEWLSFMKTPVSTNAEYGGQLWLNRAGGADRKPVLFPGKGPVDTVAAIGHLGQYVIAARTPERSVVVVRLGKTQDDVLDPIRDRLGDTVDALFRY